MLVTCMLDNKSFIKKPRDGEIGGIQKRIVDGRIKIEIEELANKLAKGCTFKPAELNGSKSVDWVSQQVFALDFDGGTTIENQLELCKELNINPAFGYTSFSHKQDVHKFRLCFVTNEVITDKNIRNTLQIILIRTFNNSDEVTKDAARLFFGGKSIICSDYDKTIDFNDIIKRFYKEEYQNDIDYLNNQMNGIKSKKSLVSTTSRKGVQDIKEYSRYPLISYTPKTLQNDTYNIKAISNRDIEYLKNKYGIGDKKVFETNQQFIDYIRKQINLAELLEVKYPKSFKCIFHEDSSPSASIFQNEEGAYIYKCNSNSCGVSYNIIGVIERLAGFKSRPKTYKFIKEIFNLEINETKWQKEQKEILLENLKVLHSGEFAASCPQTFKNINGIIHYLEHMIMIAMDNVYSEKYTDRDGNVVFFAATSYIAKQMGISSNSLNKISQKLVSLSYHKVLEKVDDSNLPEAMLKRANAEQIGKNKQYNHINFYSIPSYTFNLYPEIEERGISWKENHYTMKGISREMFYRGEGFQIANELYPQYKKVTKVIDGETTVVDRTTTNISNIRTDDIVLIIHYLIETNGYATERDIVAALKEKYKEKCIEIQIKKSLKEILDSYNLVRIRANKEVKEKFDIKSKGYPFILVKGQ